MSITSFYFLLFYALVLLIYYIVPKKGQWVILLLASLLYYFFSDNGFLIFYPLSAVLVCQAGIWRMTQVRERAQARRAAGESFVSRFLEEDPNSPSGYALRTGETGRKAVAAYRAVEDRAVGAYKKVETAFVDAFLEETDPSPKTAEAQQQTGGNHEKE